MDEPSAHLPKDLVDILTSLSPEKQSAIGDFLAEQLKQPEKK